MITGGPELVTSSGPPAALVHLTTAGRAPLLLRRGAPAPFPPGCGPGPGSGPGWRHRSLPTAGRRPAPAGRWSTGSPRAEPHRSAPRPRALPAPQVPRRSPPPSPRSRCGPVPQERSRRSGPPPGSGPGNGSVPDCPAPSHPSAGCSPETWCSRPRRF